MSKRRVCGLALLAAMLCWVGCSVGSSRTSELLGSPAIVRQAVAPTSTAEPFLYVGGWKLSMFALGSTTPLRSTKTPYVSRAALALDSRGDLCEANGTISGSAIYAFNARTLKLESTLDGEGLGPIAANRFGYLYATSGDAYLLVYAPGCTHNIKIICNCPSRALVFDQSGNLYVGGVGIRVYAPTEKRWRMKFVRAIHEGIDRPGPLAIGPSGDLFVANEGGNSSVSIFPFGGSKPIRRITKGVAYPEALAIDSTGRLYVANSGRSSAPGWVSIYAPGGTRPIRYLEYKGLRLVADALAVDPSDNLYAATDIASHEVVAAYSPGGTKPLYIIRKGVNGATALLIGSP
jgi:DNA-binding beta-propeller fold protein YncE